MIAFDNGPANGDYARYIDELVTARAATAAAAAIQADADLDAPRPVRPRPVASTASARSSREAVATSSRVPQPQATGFVTPTDAAAKASAAAAIATALMSGEVGGRGWNPVRLRATAIAAVLGAVLLFVGIAIPTTFSLLFTLAGIVLLGWAFRLVKGVVSRAAVAGSTRA